MDSKLWSRRQVMKDCARVTAGAAIAGIACRRDAGAAQLQLPPPVPLEDPSLTFVTTTEASAWQNGKMFKPRFSWDTLNLNVDPADSALTVRTENTMKGFGGCFNERGWTSLQALSDADREAVLHALFDPTAGARFTY